MAFHTDDTICAIASASGGAGRGIVRISGPQAAEVAVRCFQSKDNVLIRSIQRATALTGLVRITVDAVDRDLACDLYLWPTHRSYTREPLVELHTIGSPPLLNALMSTLCELEVRAAEPGEFTLRAFLAGRIDLTQAEAVLGVIDACGSEDLDAALVQLAGGLARPLHQLREELLQLLAEVEAGLDFVEEDIEFISPDVLQHRLERVGQILDEVSRQMATRHISRDVPQIALVGPPNAGKSSLFNALSERYGCSSQNKHERQTLALVSPQRGTTRDYLTTAISIDGRECELVDTAGVDLGDRTNVDVTPSSLQPLDSTIDTAAQMISVERGASSSIRICCLDVCGILEGGEEASTPFNLAGKVADVVVLTKVDLLPVDSPAVKSINGVPTLLTSSHNGYGLDQLCVTVGKLLRSEELGVRCHIVGATATRCRDSIHSASRSIQNAIALVRHREGNELVAVELRGALDQIGAVVGAVYTDDLLDRVFGTFCIGK